eukprot:5007744-Pyramimonas_sp.AAC.2
MHIYYMDRQISDLYYTCGLEGARGTTHLDFRTGLVKDCSASQSRCIVMMKNKYVKNLSPVITQASPSYAWSHTQFYAGKPTRIDMTSSLVHRTCFHGQMTRTEQNCVTGPSGTAGTETGGGRPRYRGNASRENDLP